MADRSNDASLVMALFMKLLVKFSFDLEIYQNGDIYLIDLIDDLKYKIEPSELQRVYEEEMNKEIAQAKVNWLEA